MGYNSGPHYVYRIYIAELVCMDVYSWSNRQHLSLSRLGWALFGEVLAHVQVYCKEEAVAHSPPLPTMPKHSAQTA